MIQNLIFEILFSKISFREYNFLYSSPRSMFFYIRTRFFFFNIRFSSKMSRSQQKIAKKNHSFCNTVLLKYYFWMPKNCIVEAFWKQISVYFCTYSHENYFSTDILLSIDINSIKALTMWTPRVRLWLNFA